jgi:hypothetical protein
MVNALVLVAALAAISLGVAQAQPSSSGPLVYHFVDCSGPQGTPSAFDAAKQGKGASFHLVDGRSDFVVVAATDATSGSTLISTPGFSKNSVATITCTSMSLVSGHAALVTGFLTPVG